MRHATRHVWALLLLIFPFYKATAQEQISNPVTWKFTTTQVNDSQYILNCTATIQKGWHVYSQHLDPSAIQNPTALTYTPSKDYSVVGNTDEDGKLITVHDTAPKEIETYYESTITFKQKVNIHNPKGCSIKGNVYFQTCNEGMCLPPKQVDFAFVIPPATITKPNTGYLRILLLGFLGGIAALFTPCVFPMVPLTVSFFTKRGKDKKKGLRSATIYGMFIIFIYIFLGTIITALIGPSGMNSIASNGWVNLFFFLIFIVFGCSFLGAFEITLPSSWVNRSDQASDRGGLFGIFFMALTLCLVSFSCTAPIVGSLLAGAAVNGSYWSLTVGMAGFSFALALPFALFAAFPNWLSSLPTSGGWLNSVKVVLGLLEIAFSLKFLSTTDLVGLHIKFLHFHLNGPMGLLKREIFVALWVIIFGIIGFYLIGKIKFHHDSDLPHISVGRLLLSIIAFAFSLYLIPGIFGAPLKLIGGFPPPSFYSEGWKLEKEPPTSSEAGSADNIRGEKRTIGCPLNLNCYHDYKEALAEAKKDNKPVMIDFTGFSCINCRKMEENVWSDPKVLSILNNDYVLVSLYVDDPTELPDSLQYTSKTTGQKVETYGDKWSDMETQRFKSNTQPLYVLMNDDDTPIAEPRGYTPDVQQYIQFLDQGKPSAGVTTASAASSVNQNQ
jgi:thiol:disulfide interchange protein DsbD